MDKILPPPRHYFSSHCDTCGIDSQLFVNFHPAIRAGRRHICDNKKITIFHHIYSYGDAVPVKEIWGATV
jgi:hypothetical protein